MFILSQSVREAGRLLKASIAASALATIPVLADEPAGKTWEIPMGGNSYLTRTGGSADNAGGGRGGRRRDRGGSVGWSNPEEMTSVYFRVDRPAELEISLKAKVPQGESTIRATIDGKAVEKDLKGAESAEVPLARISAKAAGYVKVDLQGLKKTGAVFAEVEALEVKPVGQDAAAVVLDYVKDNNGNNFYWGRRGPSIHLGYGLPKGVDVEWFYNEITVPAGSDPVGSYFMSNGFGEGYFGMQVNSPTERKILFSVWSPFKTDKPGEIPEDKKIVLLKKGEGVHGGEFGGEGSGGQSYWAYPWKAGETYRFLNRVQPDGKGVTVYTAWFYVPEKKDWQLIASFKRPQTNKHLTGAHSFLENFADSQGYLSRGAFYGNQWACDVKGEWHGITEAKFTTDPIGSSHFRMDYAGGAKDGKFFMRNGGFFPEHVDAGGTFRHEVEAMGKPVIDFKKLEGAEDPT